MYAEMNQNRSFLILVLKTSNISFCWFCRKERVGLAVLPRSQRRVQRRLKRWARRARRARRARHPKVLKGQREKDLVGRPNFGPEDVLKALKLKPQVGASSRWASGPLIWLMSSRRAHQKACASEVITFRMHFQQYAGRVRIQKHVWLSSLLNCHVSTIPHCLDMAQWEKSMAHGTTRSTLRDCTLKVWGKYILAWTHISVVAPELSHREPSISHPIRKPFEEAGQNVAVQRCLNCCSL